LRLGYIIKLTRVSRKSRSGFDVDYGMYGKLEATSGRLSIS
jgi:hypothetical protein